MKMYILVRDDIPLGKAMVAAAHASLICHCACEHLESYQEWLTKHFKKVVCKVTLRQFEKFAAMEGANVLTESTLDHEEVAIVFPPRKDKDWPRAFRKLPLYD